MMKPMDSDGAYRSGSWTASGAAVLLLIAGIIHLAIIPHHWEHAPAHGIFMGIIGAVEIIWAVAFWLKPSGRIAEAGIMIAVGGITLWGITRVVPAPYGAAPEEVDASGLVTKALELAAAWFLILIVRASFPRGSGSRARRAILEVILLSVFLGLGVYSIARASEPLFPWLKASETQEHEEHPHSPAAEAPTSDHEHDALPTP